MDQSHTRVFHKHRNLSRRAAICAASVLACGAALPSAAYATTWSTTQFSTNAGITYAYYAGIDGGLAPIAHSHISANPAIGSGELATNAQLYNGTGWLVASSGWVYGNGSTANASVSFSQNPTGSQARGYSVSYRGGTFYYYNKYSPVTYHKANIEFEKNQAGEAFGSLLNAQPDSTPDLIEALSDDGVFGYVLANDLFAPGIPTGPIPVYNKEGTIITGLFSFGNK